MATGAPSLLGKALGETAFAAVERRALPELRPHPQAALVPAMSSDEYIAFLADIRARGVLTPLDVNSKGIVLDGHHRLRAAGDLGLATLPVRVVSTENERLYIVRSALNRRHLSASQRAALAVDAADYEQLDREARTRSRANLRQNTEVATLPPRCRRTRDLAAELANVHPRTIQDAASVKAADPVLFDQVKAGTLSASKALKLVKRQRSLELPRAVPLPRGCFQLIYADPPWRSPNPSSDWSPEQHYPTLPLEEIKTMAVPAAEDAVLFLWAVSSQLREALEVMEAWGFDYRTSLVWIKDWIGMGIWVRHRHELLLVGRRGSFPAPDEPDRPDSVIEAPRGRHSQKPICVYGLLERMYPQASKLELFARGRSRRGWSAWGNEVAA